MLQSVFVLLQFLIALLCFAFELSLLVEHFLFHLKQFVLLDYFGLLVGCLQALVVYSVGYVLQYHVACGGTYYETGNANDDCYHVHVLLFIIVKHFFHFLSELNDDVGIWRSVIALFLKFQLQCYVYQRHVEYFLFFSFILKFQGIAVDGVGDTQRGLAVILFVFALNVHHHLGVVDMESYGEFLILAHWVGCVVLV